jgi:hypothetical protein
VQKDRVAICVRVGCVRIRDVAGASEANVGPIARRAQFRHANMNSGVRHLCVQVLTAHNNERDEMERHPSEAAATDQQ